MKALVAVFGASLNSIGDNLIQDGTELGNMEPWRC